MTLFADDVHPCHVDNTCHLPVVGTRSTLLPVDWYSQYRRDINSNSSKWQLTESTSGSESRIHQQSSHTALPILRTVGRVLLVQEMYVMSSDILVGSCVQVQVLYWSMGS
jgi:hypothetical protein